MINDRAWADWLDMWGGGVRFGGQGKMASISGKQENKGQILRGTGDQRHNWGTGNTRKQVFDFRGTGTQANLFRGTCVPPTPSHVRASIVSG